MDDRPFGPLTLCLYPVQLKMFGGLEKVKGLFPGVKIYEISPSFPASPKLLFDPWAVREALPNEHGSGGSEGPLPSITQKEAGE